MRLRLKGINSVRKRLASGQAHGNPGRAFAANPDLLNLLRATTVGQKITPPTGLLLSVLQGYQASENFRQLAKSTQKSYIALIRRIEAKFGSFPLSAFRFD